MNEIAQTTVDRLRELHREIIGAVRMTLDKAIEAGGILQEVKAELSHGDFTQWVENNAGFDIRTAQRYMKAHRNREQLKNDSVSFLTEAYRRLETFPLPSAESFERWPDFLWGFVCMYNGEGRNAAWIASKLKVELSSVEKFLRPAIPDRHSPSPEGAEEYEMYLCDVETFLSQWQAQAYTNGAHHAQRAGNADLAQTLSDTAALIWARKEETEGRRLDLGEAFSRIKNDVKRHEFCIALDALSISDARAAIGLEEPFMPSCLSFRFAVVEMAEEVKTRFKITDGT